MICKDIYLTLNRYLEFNKIKTENSNDNFSLNNLFTFITILNLFNKTYFGKISRKYILVNNKFIGTIKNN